MLNKSSLLENVAPERWKWNDWVWVAFSIAASCLCPNFFSFCGWHSDGHWSLECHQWSVNPKKKSPENQSTASSSTGWPQALSTGVSAYPVAASHSRHHGWFLGEKPFGNWILHEIHCSIPFRHCRMSSRPTQCPGWIKPQVTRRFHKIYTYSNSNWLWIQFPYYCH